MSGKTSAQGTSPSAADFKKILREFDNHRFDYFEKVNYNRQDTLFTKHWPKSLTQKRTKVLSLAKELAKTQQDGAALTTLARDALREVNAQDYILSTTTHKDTKAREKAEKQLAQHTDAAIRYLKEAARANFTAAYQLLGCIYDGDYPTPPKVKNNADAIKYFNLGSNIGDGYASYRMALIQRATNAGTLGDNNKYRFIYTLTRATRQREPRAALALAIEYYHGQSITKDLDEALYILQDGIIECDQLGFLKNIKADMQYWTAYIKYELYDDYVYDEEMQTLLTEAAEYNKEAKAWLDNIEQYKTAPDTPYGTHQDEQATGTIANDYEHPTEVEHSHSPLGDSTGPMSYFLDKQDAQAHRQKNAAEKIVAMTDKDIEALLEPLNALVGLKNAKQQIHEQVQYAKISARRIEAGLETTMQPFHTAFIGEPGTGKTEVARLWGKILHGLGFLSSGHVVEVDRSDLVGEYVGSTALRTKDIIQRAQGGILFIDEAYTLNKKDNTKDYGDEAITTIMKAMEDQRDDFVVIVAGYPTEMKNFLNTNPGLASRFQQTIEFETFSADEMADIFYSMCEKQGYRLSKDTVPFLIENFGHMLKQGQLHERNARSAREIFEKSLRKQATRLLQDDKNSKEALQTLKKHDIAFPHKASNGNVSYL